MAAVPDPTDPSDLTPEQRFDEIATILAGAVLRLRSRNALHMDSDNHPAPQIQPDSDANGLAECGQTRPHEQRG